MPSGGDRGAGVALCRPPGGRWPRRRPRPPGRRTIARRALTNRVRAEPSGVPAGRRGRPRVRAPGRDRRSPPPPAPPCSAPAPGTSSRICRRRSGRRGPGCRQPRGRGRDGAGSSLFRRRWPRRVAGVIQQRVVLHRIDRGEVAMGNPFRAGRLANVVRDRARASDRRCGAGRGVMFGGRGMHQIAVKHQHRAGLAGRCDDAPFVCQPGHGLLVQGP